MRTLCQLLLFISILKSQAQSSKVIGIHSRYGQIYQHSKEFEKYQYGTLNVQGIELTYHICTNGSKRWQREWKLPEWGVSLHYNDLGNPALLGFALGSTIYVQKFIWEKSQHAFSYKFAPGLVWISMTHEKNPKNVFVSTHLNFIMETNLLYHYKITPLMRLNIGGFITHYSNGAIQLPNYGFNMFGCMAGIAHTIRNPSQSSVVAFFDEKIAKIWNFDINLAHAIKSPGNQDPRRFYVGVLSGYANKRLNYKSGLTLGTDVFYHTSIHAQIGKSTPVNPWRVGIQCGHELYVSKVSLLTQIGTYIYRPILVDKPIYWRAGIKCYLSDHYFVGLSLRAHYGQADIIEWGTGIRL
ncbi:MAG: acyloxyacyl hydrolase [Cytophagales bacterium]|nr:acyloxyacyl hydrolase [Cytophagales bacterium]MDW8385081.1 acyloxyacyl hydrolase [Flammeovirgaceae bacterium]